MSKFQLEINDIVLFTFNQKSRHYHIEARLDLTPFQLQLQETTGHLNTHYLIVERHDKGAMKVVIGSDATVKLLNHAWKTGAIKIVNESQIRKQRKRAKLSKIKTPTKQQTMENQIMTNLNTITANNTQTTNGDKTMNLPYATKNITIHNVLENIHTTTQPLTAVVDGKTYITAHFGDLLLKDIEQSDMNLALSKSNLTYEAQRIYMQICKLGLALLPHVVNQDSHYWPNDMTNHKEVYNAVRTYITYTTGGLKSKDLVEMRVGLNEIFPELDRETYDKLVEAEVIEFNFYPYEAVEEINPKAKPEDEEAEVEAETKRPETLDELNNIGNMKPMSTAKKVATVVAGIGAIATVGYGLMKMFSSR